MLLLNTDRPVAGLNLPFFSEYMITNGISKGISCHRRTYMPWYAINDITGLVFFSPRQFNDKMLFTVIHKFMGRQAH